MIYIIRHGQTILNKQRQLQGRSNEPLNDIGRQEAEEAKAWFEDHGITIDCVWSSPLQRALQTAQIIAGEDSSVMTDDRLLEMDYGPYEGASLLTPPPEVRAFFSDFVHNPAPEGMEPLREIVQRLGQFLEELKAKASEGENILIATHAIAMKGALEYLTPESKGRYWSQHIGNCEVFQLDVVDGKFTVPVPSSNLHKSQL